MAFCIVSKNKLQLGILATSIQTLHAASFYAVHFIANSSDVMLGIGFLAGIYFWLLWLNNPSSKYYLGILASNIILLATKETAVVFPLLLMIWSAAFSRPNKQVLKWLCVPIVFSILYLCFLLAIKWQSHFDYLTQKEFSLSIMSFGRQVCDYGLSCFAPFLHMLDLPFVSVNYSNTVLWIIRCLFVILGLMFCILWLRKKMPAAPLVSFASAFIIIIILPALLDGAPAGRYLYSALPFVIIGVVIIVDQSNHFFASALLFVIITNCILFTLLLFHSPTIEDLRQSSANVETFVSALKAKDIKKESTIAIFNHPHPGENAESRWVYCQLLFHVYFPQDNYVIVLDQADENADYIFNFDNGILHDRYMWPDE